MGPPLNRSRSDDDENDVEAQHHHEPSHRLRESSSERIGRESESETRCTSPISELVPSRTFETLSSGGNSHHWDYDANDGEGEGSSPPPQPFPSQSNKSVLKEEEIDSEMSWRDRLIDRGLNSLYISCFAIFGTVLRIYMGRFFGLDCVHDIHSAEDFLFPLSSRICVTSSGKTDQTGGALFTDLPANMLGSFFIGLLIPIINEHPIAWFKQDHPLQRNTIFHTALKTGFCGCLTTFASWNTQMVVMMDGTDTVLGRQIASALFGYMIGLGCAVSSFFVGRHVYDFWRPIHEPSLEPESLEAAVVPCTDKSEAFEVTSQTREAKPEETPTSRVCSHWERVSWLIGIKVSPFITAMVLLALFLVADFKEGFVFYRKLWLSAVMAPVGALLRWWLTKLNKSKGYWESLEWVPWGTLCANLLGALISITAEVLESRFVARGGSSKWISSVLPAIETGFAGSLSTVSTFVSELVAMKPLHSYTYALGTIISAMCLCLVVYCPVIRS